MSFTLRRQLPRALGLIILGVILWRVGVGDVLRLLSDVNKGLFLAAVALNFPMVGLKAYRWQKLLADQGITYGLWPSFLAYYGSIFIGLLTPGRLGEFIKAAYVARDNDVPWPRAFSTVLADRLFDLFMLLIAGAVGVAVLAEGYSLVIVAMVSVLFITPLVMLLREESFGLICRIAARVNSRLGRWFEPAGWVSEIRNSLNDLTMSTLLRSTLFTVGAYALFFTQSYLVARSLEIDISYLTVVFTIALGSLVTLVPISISGLGTREAVAIAYLSASGVTTEVAVSFSLLIFVVFHIFGGLFGMTAWLLKPAPLKVPANA